MQARWIGVFVASAAALGACGGDEAARGADAGPREMRDARVLSDAAPTPENDAALSPESDAAPTPESDAATARRLSRTRPTIPAANGSRIATGCAHAAKAQAPAKSA